VFALDATHAFITHNPPPPHPPPPNQKQFQAYKVVYRRYAGLFFSIGVDAADNELATLEAVHLFVEVLDHFFSNVCELDLVFNFHKVYFILDEMVAGGELAESSKRAILERLAELERIET
jgi:AP-2 complex subunit sigma-1